MLNAVGLQNCGVEVFLRDKLPKLPWRETAVLANLYACDADEFAQLAGILAHEEGVAGLEVNISCPNVKAGGALFGQDPGQAARVTEAVKARAGNKPVMVKLSPNVTDISAVAKAVEGAGADAISLINTLTAMAVDIRTRRPRLANVIGGLSGPAVKPVALRCVWQVARAVAIPVVGLGGITTAEDILEFILVGATAVQVGTANFLRPDTAFRLVKDLEKLVAELGITSWEEFRGSLATG
jgi:dihydroorotate dehydrogenase (NAD+) catalytic subunit